MARLKYETYGVHDKPLWMLKLQCAIMQEFGGYDIDPERINDVFDFAKEEVQKLQGTRDIIRSVVTVEATEWQGDITVEIVRNGKMVQRYYMAL
ncbi:hypothetical protein [uncultured Muribaculum sp.]|uniref:hypothetical protein n=1 Tax=uncultured Muribaculum sp. TaxID=1918613 RepID=UPI0025B3A618|nr:hypothetical protein [uncultured Muribaculum sp.]